MNEELQKLREEFEERIRGLEIKYKTEEELEIKEGDNYWYVDGRGDIYNKQWEYDLCDGDFFRLGNIFITENEAKFMLEKLKVIQELKQLAKPFEVGSENYLIEFDHLNMEFIIIRFHGWQSAYDDFYFNTEEEAHQAINTIGADRIKKYLFRVED